ncbi:MAG: hypothetical protein M1582_02935, partial [Actinobacteria bacterium]|nr:hypothetical protein [Actinomycetota bacterium]
MLRGGSLGLFEAFSRSCILLFDHSNIGNDEALASGLGLLMDLLEQKVAAGDMAGAVDGLGWLRMRGPGMVGASGLADRIAAGPVELLGQCAGEHLEEILLLPDNARGEAAMVLRRGEQLIRQGHFRTAADDASRLVAARTDFLPAQSLLGRALVALGRIDEARERSRTLLTLYELRDAPSQAVEVLWWTVGYAVDNGEARARLVELLRGQNRLEEAELVERGWSDTLPQAAESVVEEPAPDVGVVEEENAGS